MIYKSSNAYSFGKSKKDGALINKSLLTTPSVGKYNKEILNKPTGGYKFSKEAKLKAIRPKTPGPGKYNPKKSLKNEPNYSINKTDKFTQIDKMVLRSVKSKAPGPGYYSITDENYEKTQGKSSIARHFNKEEKLKSKDNKNPGVGQYNTISAVDFGISQKNKFTIPKSNRKSLVDMTKTSSSFRYKGDIKALDPGYYKIKEKFGNEGTKPTLRGKPKEKKRIDTPGPADYKTAEAKRYVLKKAPTASLGYGKRSDLTGKERKKTPGFKYNIKSEFDVSEKSKIKTHTFSKTARMKKKVSDTPGPGSYHLPCSFANTPAYQNIESTYKKI